MEEEKMVLQTNIYSIKEEDISLRKTRKRHFQALDDSQEYYTEEMRQKLQQLQKAMSKNNQKENKYSTPDQNNKIKSLKKRLNTKEPLIEQINDFQFQEESIQIGNRASPLKVIQMNGTICRLVRQQTDQNIGDSRNMFQNINIEYQKNVFMKENSMESEQQKVQKIDSNTLSRMLENEQIKQKMLIIDCRFNYEFRGGHIDSALNIDNPEELYNLLIRHNDLMNPHFISFVKQLHKYLQQYENKAQNIDYRQLYTQFGKLDKENMGCNNNNPDVFLVFHCEFSKERSPKMLRFLQKVDLNRMYRYLYLLEAGYESFVGEFGTMCEPQYGYVSMFNKRMQQQKIDSQVRYDQNWNKVKQFKNTTHNSIC